MTRLAAHLRLVLLGLAALALSAGGVAAQPFGGSASEGPKATVELLIADQTVRPGQTVPVGVKFTMEPGWHIYWHNPGDAGEPPEFRWNLPGGGAARAMRGGEWKATEPQFPTPIRWVEPSGIVGYGYADTVIFPAELTVPDSATPGQSAEVSVAVNYLVCDEICLAESAVATASVTVGAAPEPNESATEAIAAAKRMLPVPVDATPHVKAVRLVHAEDDPAIREMTVEFASGVENVDLFPDPPAGIAVEDVTVEQNNGVATIRFRTRPLAGSRVTETSFPAVIGFTTDDMRIGVRTEIPVRDPVDE